MTVLNTFGITFQEESVNSKSHKLRTYLRVQLMWQVLTMFMTMFFLAVLKSVLTDKRFEKRTMSISEIMDKDMVLHTLASTMEYFESPEGQLNPLYRRMECQTRRKNSVFKERCGLFYILQVFK